MPSNIRFCTACGQALEMRTPAQPFAAGATSPSPSAQPIITADDGPAGTVAAGPGVRAAAFLLDLATIISPALPLSIVGALLSIPEVISVVVPVASTAVWIWIQIWAGLTGKTVGKTMLGLRIVRVEDQLVPGFGPAVLRSLIFAVTLGVAAWPVVFGGSGPRVGLHDRLSGLTIVDVTVGDNPLGRRPQTPLRRSPHRSVNRVQSPVPVSTPRHL